MDTMAKNEIIITDPKQPFLKDENNKPEKHNHQYYRLLWHERPPNQKKIPQYWQWIQVRKKEKNLRYDPPKRIETIYDWYHRWNWQDWETEQIHREINKDTKNKITNSTNYVLKKISDETVFFMDFLNLIKKEMEKGFKNFDINNPHTSKIIIQLVTLYSNILRLQAGLPCDVNESYNIVRSLANENAQSTSSSFVEMLEESKKYFIEYGAKEEDDSKD